MITDRFSQNWDNISNIKTTLFALTVCGGIWWDIDNYACALINRVNFLHPVEHDIKCNKQYMQV